MTPLPDNTRIDTKLAGIADSMSALLESRLMMNLDEMSFVLESPATVNLVVGSGRVETVRKCSLVRPSPTLSYFLFYQWILPLLYLVLKRHLDIMTLAQSHIIHEKEFISHSKTLESIFSLFNDRIEHLQCGLTIINLRNISSQLLTIYSLAIFRTHINHDEKVQFEKFAFGMVGVVDV